MHFSRSGAAIKKYGSQGLNQVHNLIPTMCWMHFYGSATRLRSMSNLDPFFYIFCLDLLYDDAIAGAGESTRRSLRGGGQRGSSLSQSGQS